MCPVIICLSVWLLCSVSHVFSPAVARSGQKAALWHRGGELVSRTAAGEQLDARTLGGAEVSLRGRGASLCFLYEDLAEDHPDR